MPVKAKYRNFTMIFNIKTVNYHINSEFNNNTFAKRTLCQE